MIGWAGLTVAVVTLIGIIVFFKLQRRNQAQSMNEESEPEKEPEYVKLS
jgi:hypothetical protein